MLTTQHDHATYVKHVFGHIYVVFTLVGVSKGWVHNLLVQFFTLGSSKIEVFETYFDDTMIT